MMILITIVNHSTSRLKKKLSRII